MVDSVNAVNSVTPGTYNITFEELDANKDGKVDKTDYDMLQGYLTDEDETNDLKVTADDLDKIFDEVLSGEKTVLEDCPGCVATPPEDTEEEITLDNVNAKADALITDTARTEIDPTKATTIAELTAMQETLTAQIAEYDAVEKVLLEKIEKLQETLAGLQAEAEEQEEDYTNTANEAENKAQAAQDSATVAQNKASAAAEEVAESNNKTANKILENFKAGEYGDESLQSVLERELGYKITTSAEGEAADAAAEANKLSDEVTALSSQLAKIASNIDAIKTAAASNTDDLTATISDRDSVLQLRQADSDKFQDAYNVKENLEKVEEPVPETKSGGGGCDPMSFVKDNIKYDFIQDRDNDNIFDDATEFLGAQDGWAEMQAYDTNQDGKIEGDELKEMKIVGVDQTTGKYTFSTADAVGVTSIDLSTYQEAGTTKNTGDTLDGTFKVNIGGQEVDAEQTTDTAINLTNKYGSLFGKEVKDYGETFETNPFTSAFEANVNAGKLALEAADAADDADDAADDAANPDATTPTVEGGETSNPATTPENEENEEDPNKKEEEK